VALEEAGFEVRRGCVAWGVDGEHDRELAAPAQGIDWKRCEGEAKPKDLRIFGPIADGEESLPIGLLNESRGCGRTLGQDLCAGRSRSEEGLVGWLTRLRRVEELEQSIGVAEQRALGWRGRNQKGEIGWLQGLALPVHSGPRERLEQAPASLPWRNS